MKQQRFHTGVEKIDRRSFLLSSGSALILAQEGNGKIQGPGNRNNPTTRIVPSPQFFAQVDGRMPLTQGQILCGGTPKEALAAELLIDEARKLAGAKTLSKAANGRQRRGTRISLVDWGADSPLKAEITALLSEKDKQLLTDPSRSEQSYVVRMDSEKKEIVVAGSSPMGVLYGATTLRQILQAESGRLFVPVVHVRDFPDFKYRAAADWLLFAELNRWAYDWGDGKRAFVKRIKRKLDFCLSYKINMVFFDGFGWHSEKFPGYGSLMRELNQYARERGIKLLFAGYGANTQPSAIRPERNIGTVWRNQDSYPNGSTYPCFGHEDIPGPYLGTCRANEELNRLKAKEMEQFVRDVEPGALYIHHEDRGVGTPKEGDPHEDELWRTWKKRDERCRERWPSDDLLAKDGGAGAVAYGYRNYLDTILKVKNADSGYSGAEDCEITLISPGYNPIPTDHKDWNNHLEFWANVLSFLPIRNNVSIGFREIFPQRGTNKRWVDAYKEKLTPLKLNSRMFFFFLGGGDQYRNNYPFVSTSIMNGLFEGGDTIYNFSGAVHQEPLQVLNAEFSWNTKAPGYRIPKTYEESRSLWEALSENRETPEPIFGADGFLPMICQRIYGKQAGPVMSRFMVLYEPQPRNGNDPLAPTLPEKLYPLSVLWGPLSRDEPSWTLQISHARTLRVLQKSNTTEEEWQVRLSRVWAAYASVTDKGIVLVQEALHSKDLIEDARVDIGYLLKCLGVGRRFADLLASFHTTLASSGDSAKLKNDIYQTQRKFNELSTFLDSNFAFDTVCPMGGDQGIWLESLEKVRNNLQRLTSRDV